MILFRLLALPVTAPTNGMMSIFRLIQREVDAEHDNPEALRAQLTRLQQLLEDEAITEEEYEALEEDILDRLDALYEDEEDEE